MVFGFERINERTRRPNKFINFIKPLEGPDKVIAQDYLERVAAIVFPIMRDNHLSVMSLEEHEPNKEFWGRNFNFGEIIQLVLKSHNGMWLPMHHVQLVMIHELAHVKEMNHGRYFHRFRISMQAELQGLKSKGYTGEGFWAPGKILHPSAAAVQENRPLFGNEIPLDLCGGFYKRASGRRRRRRQAGATEEKEVISYAERKRRRIVKKFGFEEGNNLGADVEKRARLENSAYGGSGGNKPTKATMAKPRVAQSNRGRELRLQAVLARLGDSTGACDMKDESKTAEDKKSVKITDFVKEESKRKYPDMSDVIELDDDETEDDYESDGGEITYVKAESDTEDEDKDELEKEFSELSCQPPRPREFRGQPIIAIGDEGDEEDVVVMTPPVVVNKDKGKERAIDVQMDDEATSPGTLVGDESMQNTRRNSVISIDDHPDDNGEQEVDKHNDMIFVEGDLDADEEEDIPRAQQTKQHPSSVISIGNDDDNDDDLYESSPFVPKSSLPENITTTNKNNEETETTKDIEPNKSQNKGEVPKTPSAPTTTKNMDPNFTKSPPAAPRSTTSLFSTIGASSSSNISSANTQPIPMFFDDNLPQPARPSSGFSMNRIPSPPPQAALVCEACSTPNDPSSTLCIVCSNVVSPSLPSWKCRSAICASGDGKYRNSDDCGVCGVCGERKP